MTGEPGVTGGSGEPSVVGVVCVPGLPGVVGGTGHWVPGPSTGYRSFDRYRVLPGPGVTGTFSDCTGQSTGDC